MTVSSLPACPSLVPSLICCSVSGVIPVLRLHFHPGNSSAKWGGRRATDVHLDGGPTRRTGPPRERIVVVDGIRCADGLQTLVDVAGELDDDVWEQALESALRKRLVTVSEIEDHLPELSRSRTPGTSRIRRVLERRPDGAPPTASLLETLFIQLAREVPDLPEPVRQCEIFDAHGNLIARVDVCWPDLGLFVELDGQQHQDQPVYDARRETAVVAATGWLPGRFTWREVVTLRRTTGRRLGDLADQARGRPPRN